MKHCRMKKFEYKELPGEDYVRIMELLPGKKEDAIQCYLTSELRQDAINNYDAVSYTWGESTDPFGIICCNETLSATTNLVDALREIREIQRQYPKTPRRLWVDAVCIDQDNNKERNHQVKQLGQVYQNARQVFACLGPDKYGIAKDCFDIIRKWNGYLDQQFRIYGHTRNIPPLEPPPHLCIDADEGSKLETLMKRPWFSRVWVLQEAGLAKDCLLIWGNQSMSLEELIEFACFCDGRTDIARLIGSDLSIFRFWRLVFLCVYRTYNNVESWRCTKPLIRSLNQKYHDSPGLFLDVLQVGKSLSATNGRDYIYAFLGNPLAYSNDGKLLIEPDYDKAEKDVYCDAALAFLERKHESPYVLCFVQHSSADEVTGSRGPSWAPKWKPQEDPTPFYTIGNIGLNFKAGGLIDRLQYRHHRGFGAERLLSLQGILFDYLAWTSEPLRTENFALNPTQWDAELRTSQQTYIDMLWKDVLLAFHQLYGPAKAPESALIDGNFSYTLVTGYNNLRVIKSKEHRKKFKAYHQALKSAGRPEDYSGAALSSGKQACDASRYEVNTRNCSGRRLALTRYGRFALVPQFAKPGDICCVFLGMTTPFIIRQAVMKNHDRGEYHHLVGEAYIHDVMQGKLVDELDRGDIEQKEITLM